MNKDRNALKAGLFIVASTVLVIAVVIAIKGTAQFTDRRVTHYVTFRLGDDLGGLRAGDDVRVGGYKVGNVTEIKAAGFDGADPRLVVAFTLPGAYALHDDAHVNIQSTLTGAASLNVDYLGKGRVLTPGGGDVVLAGRPDPKTVLIASLGSASGDIADAARDIKVAVVDVRTQTVPKANAALDTFRGTGDAATGLVTDVRGQVKPAIERYNVVADKTAAMMQSITDMVGPATTDWKGLLKNLNDTSAALKDKLPGMLTKLEGSLDDAQVALQDVQKTVANTRDLSESLKTVIGRNEGKLDNIIGGLKTTSDNLKAASAEIRHSPWRLLYKPGPGEVANLNTFDAARQFAEGAGELNDAATALRDAVKAGAKPEDVTMLMNRLDASFAKFQDVEGKLWKEVKK